MSYFSFGDSIPTSAGASAAAKGFINLLAADLAAAFDNAAVSTSMAMDQYDALLARSFTSADTAVVMLGTNDQAKYGLDAAKRGYYIDALRAYAMRIGSVYSEATAANGVTFTGSWGNGYAWGCQGSYVPGSKASFTTSGPVALLEFLRQANNGSTFGVKIDGVDKGVFSSNGDVTSLLGRAYGPQCLSFAGLGAGAHAVEVQVLTGDSSNVVFFKAFSSCAPKANVVFVNTPHAVAYTYGGSSANVDAYNAALSALVAELAGYGIPVKQAVHSLAACDMHDNVHPNDFGHVKIRNAVYLSITGGAAPLIFTAGNIQCGSDGFLYGGQPGDLKKMMT